MIYNRRKFFKQASLISSGIFLTRPFGYSLYAQSNGSFNPPITEGSENNDGNSHRLSGESTGNIYHIDPELGNDNNDGLTTSHPFKTYKQRNFSGGDKILFKRGSIIRDMLYTRNGENGSPIIYGSYGEGDKPTFLGSVQIGDTDQWIEESPSIWRYSGTFSSKVCNLVFNNGEECGNMRWNTKSLKNAGEWHYTDNASGDIEGAASPENSFLYLYSPINPGKAYRDIECVLWGKRKLVGGQRNIILENLIFRNSGVHGYQEFNAHDIIIRDCEFRFIGGAIFDREKKIRLGNAIELWDGASNITVERCSFDNIYDSGVTHQGGGIINIPEKLYFRNNHFSNCGFSAYECREPSQEVYFEDNTCMNAGGGFSMQGELPPRQSEIYPQPVGHHVFIWKIDPGTQPGHVYIQNNIFIEAPYGAAIYSMIDQADEQKFILDHNKYWQTTGDTLVHWGGRSYSPNEFKIYQTNCKQDKHSKISKVE